jgi:hypothetical protein
MRAVATIPDSAHSFVQALIRQVMGRPATAQESAQLGAYIAATGDFAGVANYVVRLPEARERLVVSWFARFLSRLPANGEEGPYVAALLAGQQEELVLASLLANDFVPQAPDATFLADLYPALLGRAPTAQELFLGLQVQLPQVGRVGVAFELLTGAEYRGDYVVGNFYALNNLGISFPPYLHFAALLRQQVILSPAQAVAWVNSGLDLTGLTVAILSSPPFSG